MPNISQFAVATAVTDDDVLLGNDGTVTKQFPATVVRAYLGGMVLIWDDVSDYIPTGLKASAGPKEFRGPTNPNTVSGVVLNPYDTWINTA